MIRYSCKTITYNEIPIIMLSHFLLLLFCLFTLSVFAYFSSLDFDMETQEFKEYCHNVKWGIWPDFKNQEAFCEHLDL